MDVLGFFLAEKLEIVSLSCPIMQCKKRMCSVTRFCGNWVDNRHNANRNINNKNIYTIDSFKQPVDLLCNTANQLAWSRFVYQGMMNT